MTSDTDIDTDDAPEWAIELLEKQRELIEATEDLADAIREERRADRSVAKTYGLKP